MNLTQALINIGIEPRLDTILERVDAIAGKPITKATLAEIHAMSREIESDINTRGIYYASDEQLLALLKLREYWRGARRK